MGGRNRARLVVLEGGARLRVSGSNPYDDPCDCETDAYGDLYCPSSVGEGTGDKEATERFGPLKATLGTIPAVCANEDVRSPLRLIYSLTNTFSGSRGRRKQGRGSPLEYS
jgi:hypothetical protein